MLFNSTSFAAFFIPVYLLYLLLPHRWQNILLIIASGIFYACWSLPCLGLLLAVVTVGYWCAEVIDQSQDPKQRKAFLIASIAFNLLVLGFFKYFNFFASSLALIEQPLNIILPLGISFYTFEAISYVVDVYRRQTKPAQSYGDYLLFIIYFPHLIAGPIMRAKNFLGQIQSPRHVTWDQFYEGSFIFFFGLFEKMFVADNLAKIVDPVFSHPGPYEGGEVLLALYAFAVQILCDFDGYSNMARGLGKCMGFEITINFQIPYAATNARQFWQRWHISLSTWLRDYVYIPLGGNRHGRVVMNRALIITMLLGGLWHGAAWTFIAWGLYHGLLLVVDRREANLQYRNPFMAALNWVVFVHVVVFGWLLFRAQSFAQVGDMINALCFNRQGINGYAWLTFISIVAPFVVIQIWQYNAKDLLVVYHQHWLFKTLIYAFLAYLCVGWGVMDPQKFIYFQF